MGGCNRSYIDLNDSHACLSYQGRVIKNDIDKDEKCRYAYVKT
jgi:hypothetical protein